MSGRECEDEDNELVVEGRGARCSWPPRKLGKCSSSLDSPSLHAISMIPQSSSSPRSWIRKSSSARSRLGKESRNSEQHAAPQVQARGQVLGLEGIQ